MDIASERAYPTPYANSAILPLLLLSLSSQRISPKMTRNIGKEYDYIIVGGGTAGSVVANRLSELPCVNVLLLEAGKDPPLLTEVPVLSKFFKFTDIDWNYKTVPQTHTGESLFKKQIPLSSGKTLGGSSVLNSMVTTRGNPLDYDSWAAKGADGWSYEDVQSYFQKMEDNRDPEYIKNGFHSTGGLLTVQRPRYQSELKKPLFQAARSIGLKVVDPNALRQTGFYDFQATLRKGQRCSTSKAYLVPAENRTNLHILPKAMVRKIVIEDGEAMGVEYDYENETIQVLARREVILSAGTINSAQLLMLSGIGPKNDLEKYEIPVVADLPVGENLQDHCSVPISFLLNSSIPSILMKLVNPENVDQYIETRNGVLSSPGFITALGFVNAHEQSRNNSTSFQIRIFEDTTVISKLHYGLRPEVYSQVFGKYENKPFITCFSQTLHPRSRGTVKLKSKNPYDPPLIDPNYLQHPNDVKDVVEGLKVCKKLAGTQAMKRLGVTAFDTVFPGCEDYKKDELYFWCLAKQIVISMNNPVGTVKMGNLADPTTVVDSQLRVKYIKRLRVVDASVMPTIISGDTYVPTIMIAERASDIIKATIDCEDEMAESDVQASVPVISISPDILERLPKLLKPAAQRRSDTNAALDQLKEAFGIVKPPVQRHSDTNADLDQLKEALGILKPPPAQRHSDTSIDLDHLKEAFGLLPPPVQRRSDANSVMNQIKEAFGLYNRDKEAYHTSVTDKLQSRIRELSNTLQDSTANRRRQDAASAASMNDLIRCLEQIKQQLQEQKRKEISSTVYSNNGGSDVMVNQIIAALNSATQNNGQRNFRSAASSDEIPPVVMNQIISIMELLKEDRDVSETSSSKSVEVNSQTVSADTINQILSALNPTRADGQPPQIQVESPSGGGNANNQDVLLNQILSALQSTSRTDQSTQPSVQNHIQLIQNELQPLANQTPSIQDNTTQPNIQDQLNQILSSINELRQAPMVAQNQTTESAPVNNITDKSQDMMHQILSAVNEMKEATKQNASQTTTTPSSNGNPRETELTKILQTLNEMKQNGITPRQAEIGNSPTNDNRNNTNDSMLSQIVTSINEMKQEIKAVKNLNGQNLGDSVHRQGISTLQSQTQPQNLPQVVQSQNLPQVVQNQNLPQVVQNQNLPLVVQNQNPAQVQNQQIPLVETVILQQPANPPQVNGLNPLLQPAIQPGMNGLPINPQLVNPVANLLQGQRTFQAISSLLGRNPAAGMNQPPMLPPPMMGMPPGMFPNPQFPGPLPPPAPPFLPPRMPLNPCQRTVVLNNINLCNMRNNPLIPLTPREAELCQSLLSATHCQNGANCRTVPPYLYNYYCGGK